MNYWDVKSSEDFYGFAGPLVNRAKPKGGILTITLPNWRLLEPLLYTMVDMSHAIFRGVEQDTYDLEPSIFRRPAFKQMKTIDERNDYIERSYNHFVAAIRGRRGPLSKPLDTYNRFELWSSGRHFGVKNTLLDWSHSPHICLFFAFARRTENGTRTLFCLKRNVIEDARPKVPATRRTDDIALTANPEYESLLFYTPLSDDNFRMINQQGLFSVSRSPHTVEEWVVENYDAIADSLRQREQQEREKTKRDKLTSELASGWVLLRIDIETEAGRIGRRNRGQILKWLNRMNINCATLFPDVEGASLYANMQGDIQHY